MKLKKLATFAVLSTLALSAAATVAVSADALSDARNEYSKLQDDYKKLTKQYDDFIASIPSGDAAVNISVISKTEKFENDLKDLAKKVSDARKKVEELEKDPKPSESKPSESKPSESKPSESKPSESKPSSSSSSSSSSSTSSSSSNSSSNVNTQEENPALKTTRFLIKGDKSETMIADPEVGYQEAKATITYKGKTYKYDSTTEKDNIRTHYYVLAKAGGKTPAPKKSDKKQTRVGSSQKVLPKTSAVK